MDGALCGEDVVGRDGLHWHGSHERQPLELNESTKLLHNGKEADFEGHYIQRQEGKTQGNFHSYPTLLHCCYIYTNN